MGYLLPIIIIGVILYLTGVFEKDDSPEVFSEEWFDEKEKWKKENKNKPKYVHKSTTEEVIDKIKEKSEEVSVFGFVSMYVWYTVVIFGIAIVIWIFSMMLSGPLEI